MWAKHLFNQLFGAEDPDEAVSPDGHDPENMADAGQNALANIEAEKEVYLWKFCKNHSIKLENFHFLVFQFDFFLSEKIVFKKVLNISIMLIYSDLFA